MKKSERNLDFLATPVLWRELRSADSDRIRYEFLKVLLVRCREKVTDNLITPEIMTTLQNILQQRDPAVKVVATALIGVFAKSPELKKIIFRKKVANALIELIKCESEKEVSAIHSNNRIRKLLLQEAANVLVQLSIGRILDRRQILATTPVIQVLTDVCTPTKSKLFSHTQAAQEALKSLTIDKTLIGHYIEMNSETILEQYKIQYGESHSKLCLPEKLYAVELYDTSMPDIEVDIRDSLIQSKTVWPCTEKERTVSNDSEIPESSIGKEEQEEMCDWKDICVTHVINGCYFWAQIGSKSMDTVTKVSKILSEYPESKRERVCTPPRTFCFVWGHTPELGYFRGQVINADEDTEVCQVRSLDYGMIVNIKWTTLFWLTRDMNLKIYPPQAVLCRLKGVCGGAHDPELIQTLLGILLNLCTDGCNVPDFVPHTNTLEMVLDLIQCPEPGVVVIAAKLISNMARDDMLCIKLGGRDAINIICDVVTNWSEILERNKEENAVEIADSPDKNKSLDVKDNSSGKGLTAVVNGSKSGDEVASSGEEMNSSKEDIGINRISKTDTETEQLIMFCLYAIANLLHNCAENKDRFCEGICITQIIALAQPDIPRCVRRLACRVLHVFTGDVDLIAASLQTGNDKTGCAELARELDNMGYSRERRNNRDDHDRSSRSRSQSTGRHGSLDGSRQRSHSRGRTRALSQQQILTDYSRGDDLGMDDVTSAEDTDGEEAVAVDTAIICDNDMRRYILGGRVAFKSDETIDIYPIKTITEGKEFPLMEKIVALLNTGKGGQIYMGISKHSKIWGIQIDRNQRDELRQGIDKIMGRIRPVVHHNLFSVLFHKVITPEKTIIEDLMVIEIELKETTSIYLTSHSQCYFRRGTENVLYSTQDIHRHIIEMEEKPYLLELESLELELQKLQAELQERNST